MTEALIRPAAEADVPAMNAIYNEYIVGSHVSFDTEPWSDDERRSWYRSRSAAGYPILVVEVAGRIVGTAWSGPWRDKAAYRGSVESTVVLAADAIGAGVGSRLLESLVSELTASGFHTAIAIIALPNDGSIALHRKLGYQEVGVLHGVGFKGDAYHDTMIMEKNLEP